MNNYTNQLWQLLTLLKWMDLEMNLSLSIEGKIPINLTKEKIIELGKRSNVGFDQIIFIEKEK